MTVMSGGFGLCELSPENLHRGAEGERGENLTVISNNCGADNFGLWSAAEQ